MGIFKSLLVSALILATSCGGFIVTHRSCHKHQPFQGKTSYEGDEDLFHLITEKGTVKQEDARPLDNMVSEEKLNPKESINPGDVIPLLMYALQNNDIPRKDDGIRAMWEFSTDTTKYIFQNNITGEYCNDF